MNLRFLVPWCAAVLLSLVPLPAGADSLWQTGAILDVNARALPGVSVAWGADGLLDRRLRFRFDYVSSRLGVLAGTRMQSEDRFGLHALWHFTSWDGWEPYAGLELGYVRFDRPAAAFDLLPNSAPTLAVRAGLDAPLLHDQLRLGVSAGFHALTSSTVYPITAALGLAWRFADVAPVPERHAAEGGEK